MSKSGRRQRITSALHKTPETPAPKALYCTMRQMKKVAKTRGLPSISAELKPVYRLLIKCGNEDYEKGRRHAEQGRKALSRHEFLKGDWDDKTNRLINFVYGAYIAGYKSYHPKEGEQDAEKTCKR